MPEPRRPRVIDIHAHYFPRAYLNLFNGAGRAVGAAFRETPEGFHFTAPPQASGPLPMKFIDLDLRLAEMDRQGVDVQALSLTGPMVNWGDAELSQALAATWNDAAVAAHRAHPDRLLVLATLPMLHPDRAIAELDRVVALPGVRGVCIGTHIDGRDLDDPLFQPILARIEALGLPLFLHPLAPVVGSKRLTAYSFPNLVGFPIDTAIAACHLIFGGVLDRFPRLQVNLPHAGGVLPVLTGRLDHGWRTIAAAKTLAQAPSTYLQRFTYDIITHSKPLLEFVIAQVGIDRIVLGSDFCFEVGYQRPIAHVDALGLAAADRDKILGCNAARLLRV